MAAPSNKCLNNLNGTWTMSKSLSDDFDPVLALQGVPWIKRKVFALSTINLHISQYLLPNDSATATVLPKGSNQLTQIDIEQVVAPIGIKNKELRTLNGVENENDDPTFGLMKGSSRWIEQGDGFEKGLDAYLKGGWLVEGRDGALTDGMKREWILSTARNEKNKWTFEGVWGFQEIGGKRYYCRKLIVKKGDVALKVRLVYEWVKDEI